MPISTSDMHRDVSTVHQSRLGVFQPTRRPLPLSAPMITPWGVAIITGALGQQHQDALEAAWAVAEKIIQTEDGAIHLKIDPYLLRRELNNTPYCTIRDWLRQLRAAEVHIKTEKLDIYGGILSDLVIEHDGAEIDRPARRVGVKGAGARHYWRITISRAWATLRTQDLLTNYRGHLSKILRMSGPAQAIARFMLSHRGPKPRGALVLLRDLGHKRPDRALKEVHQDAGRLEDCGILLNAEGEVSVQAQMAQIPGKQQTFGTDSRKLGTDSRKLGTDSRKNSPPIGI